MNNSFYFYFLRTQFLILKHSFELLHFLSVAVTKMFRAYFTLSGLYFTVNRAHYQWKQTCKGPFLQSTMFLYFLCSYTIQLYTFGLVVLRKKLLRQGKIKASENENKSMSLNKKKYGRNKKKFFIRSKIPNKSHKIIGWHFHKTSTITTSLLVKP